MRICFVAVALLASFTSAVAGQNPHVFVYVDFAPPNRVHRVDPQPYDIISAYLMIDCVPNGFRGIGFAVHVTPEMSLYTSYINLMPDPAFVDGTFEEGIFLTSFGCVADYPIPFAEVAIVCSGTPGDVMIIEDPRYPRWVADCHEPFSELDYYCLLSHGGVGKDPVPTGEMCGCPTPARDGTWGVVKSLFR